MACPGEVEMEGGHQTALFSVDWGGSPRDGLRWSRDQTRKPLLHQLSSHFGDVASSGRRASVS